MNYYPTLKRVLDILLSSVALLFLSPFFYIIAALIKLDSKGPVFFKQQRFGKSFKPFNLIKFRSMSNSNVRASNPDFNPGNKTRVTKVGSFLRKTKLDELPELINIINGDMSIIGPRPEVERYVKLFHNDYNIVLKIRPGLSDFASMKYRNEEEILVSSLNPEKEYKSRILPDKINLAKNYSQNISFTTDLKIIVSTIKSIFWSNM